MFPSGGWEEKSRPTAPEGGTEPMKEPFDSEENLGVREGEGMTSTRTWSFVEPELGLLLPVQHPAQEVVR